MLYGMGTVVVFLGLLVIITSAMSALVNRYFPEAPAAVPWTGRESSPGAGVDGEIVAAISAALAQHRRRKNQP